MDNQGTPNAIPQQQEVKTPEAKPQGQPTGTASKTQAAPDLKGAAQEAAKEAMRKMRIDDQEIDEAEVIKVFKERKGHQQEANKRFQEGLKAKKQAEQFIAMMKDKGKLFDALKKLGHDPRQLSEEYLANVIQEEMMDPRERELKQIKAELEAEREEKKRTKELEQKKIDEELRAKYSKQYTEEFVETLKKTGLPATKVMVAEMAKYVARAAKIGFQMTADEAAKLVKEDIEAAHRGLYGEADAETLVRLLGDSGLQKIRQYDVQKIKDPAAQLKTPTDQQEVQRKQRDQSKRMTPQEWREFNRK